MNKVWNPCCYSLITVLHGLHPPVCYSCLSLSSFYFLIIIELLGKNEPLFILKAVKREW